MWTLGKTLAATVLAGLVGVNAVAYMQARAMTQFTAAGARTEPPERLSGSQALRVLLLGVNVPRPRNAETPADIGLKFETRRFASGHGPTLEAWFVPASGRQEIVAAFHGYAGSKSSLLPTAHAFHELGYPTLLVDFYGSGGSSGNNTSLGILEAKDVAATVRFARENWPGRKIVLYGFSMGSAAILRAIAAEGAQPDALVLEAAFGNLLTTTRNRFETMGLPGTPFAELLLFWGGLQWGFDPFELNPSEWARAVASPTLLLHGSEDARVLKGEVVDLKQAFGDRAILVEYPGVPHSPAAAARPEDWRRDVGAFLERL